MLRGTIIIDMKCQHIVDLHHASNFVPTIAFIVIGAILVAMILELVLAPEDGVG